jgi:flagellar hook-associated protein 2
MNSNLILEMDVSIREIDTDIYEIPSPPQGPAIPEGGKIEFEGIFIQNQPSQIDLPRWSPPPPPEVSRDLHVLFFQEEGGITPFSPLSNKPSQTMKIQLKDVVSSLNGLNFRNNNSHRDISIGNIRIYDPEARGEYVPANPISTASDAILTIDGIRVQRPDNAIDDLIPGVTLNVQGSGKEKVILKIEPDKEAIKDSIITFVGHYNALLSEIHILTRNDEAVIEEIQYFTDEEREKANEKLGILQGDITLMQLKTRLQRVMMNPYVTSAGSSLTLLAQLGISTDSRSPGTGGLDSVKLRGYLEIDENKLDEAIANMLPAVRDLFGRDQDGDLVVDSGIAFLSDTQATAYVQSGGIIPMKLQTLDSQIARTNKDIENYTVRLERKEQQLKEKYGMMEGALENMEKTSQSLDNFTKSTQSN